MANIKMAVDELHKCFEKLNKAFFNGELPEPAIVILNQGKHKNALGWCTLQEVWHSADKTENRYELNICAERLNREVLSIAETMLHEMVHLHDNVNKIKDTSRGLAYHNKSFKASAEAHGLEVAYDKKIGWSLTRLSEETEEIVKSFKLNPAAFSIARIAEGDGNGEGKTKEKKTSSSRKYICPVCGNIVRATKDVLIACMGTEENQHKPTLFEKEETEENEPEGNEPEGNEED